MPLDIGSIKTWTKEEAQAVQARAEEAGAFLVAARSGGVQQQRTRPRYLEFHSATDFYRRESIYWVGVDFPPTRIFEIYSGTIDYGAYRVGVGRIRVNTSSTTALYGQLAMEVIVPDSALALWYARAIDTGGTNFVTQEGFVYADTSAEWILTATTAAAGGATAELKVSAAVGGTSAITLTADSVDVVGALTATGTITGADNLTGIRNLGTGSELTIAAGVITITESYHTVDTESDAASDTLVTINGGSAGDILIIQAANNARDVIVDSSNGNIRIGGNITLDHSQDKLFLIYDGVNSKWCSLAAFQSLAS